MNQLSIFCDGGARGNPGPAACAFVIRDESGKIFHQEGKYLGRATNNQAEYQAVILAFEWLVKNQSIVNHPRTRTSAMRGRQSSIISFYLDSKLVVNQLNGRFKIKNRNLQQLAVKVKQLERKLRTRIFYHFIRREKNKEADKLLNQVLAAQS